MPYSFRNSSLAEEFRDLDAPSPLFAPSVPENLGGPKRQPVSSPPPLSLSRSPNSSPQRLNQQQQQHQQQPQQQDWQQTPHADGRRRSLLFDCPGSPPSADGAAQPQQHPNVNDGMLGRQQQQHHATPTRPRLGSLPVGALAAATSQFRTPQPASRRLLPDPHQHYHQQQHHQQHQQLHHNGVSAADALAPMPSVPVIQAPWSAPPAGARPANGQQQQQQQQHPPQNLSPSRRPRFQQQQPMPADACAGIGSAPAGRVIDFLSNYQAPSHPGGSSSSGDDDIFFPLGLPPPQEGRESENDELEEEEEEDRALKRNMRRRRFSRFSIDRKEPETVPARPIHPLHAAGVHGQISKWPPRRLSKSLSDCSMKPSPAAGPFPHQQQPQQQQQHYNPQQRAAPMPQHPQPPQYLQQHQHHQQRPPQLQQQHQQHQQQNRHSVLVVSSLHTLQQLPPPQPPSPFPSSPGPGGAAPHLEFYDGGSSSYRPSTRCPRPGRSMSQGLAVPPVLHSQFHHRPQQQQQQHATQTTFNWSHERQQSTVSMFVGTMEPSNLLDGSSSSSSAAGQGDCEDGDLELDADFRRDSRLEPLPEVFQPQPFLGVPSLGSPDRGGPSHHHHHSNQLPQASSTSAAASSAGFSRQAAAGSSRSSVVSVDSWLAQGLAQSAPFGFADGVDNPVEDDDEEDDDNLDSPWNGDENQHQQHHQSGRNRRQQQHLLKPRQTGGPLFPELDDYHNRQHHTGGRAGGWAQRRGAGRSVTPEHLEFGRSLSSPQHRHPHYSGGGGPRDQPMQHHHNRQHHHHQQQLYQQHQQHNHQPPNFRQPQSAGVTTSSAGFAFAAPDLNLSDDEDDEDGDAARGGGGGGDAQVRHMSLRGANGGGVGHFNNSHAAADPNSLGPSFWRH